MDKYTLKVSFKSPALIGSGEGFGAIIDSDIVFDEIGIPYIPAKRIKGCLRDSAEEVKDMFKIAEIDKISIDMKTFGEKGRESDKSSPVYFSNLVIENYNQNRLWLEYFLDTNKYNAFLSKDYILETFTQIRQQTKIDPDTGIAFKNSLRTIRLLDKGSEFYGDIYINTSDKDNADKILNTIILACMNFRCMGTQRNRGFGELTCSLLKGKKEISIKDLKDLCIN